MQSGVRGPAPYALGETFCAAEVGADYSDSPLGKGVENESPANRRKHGPDQDIAAPRHVVEFLEIALGLRGVEEIPLDQPGVKESLDRSLVESRIGDSKPKLDAEAAECAR